MTMNAEEKVEKLTKAADLIAEGVRLAYEVYPNDEFDIGLGFADTTAGEISNLVNNLKNCEKMLQPKPITGYLLEYENNGNWRPREFDPIAITNIWGYETISNAFVDEEICVGLFPELGEHCRWNSYDDWKFRLGVNFDVYSTPAEDPHECGIWGGVDMTGKLWRVRKVTINGEMSEKAKDFFRKYPHLTFVPTCK